MEKNVAIDAFVIDALRTLLKENCIVFFVTAAFNVKGKTLHSLLKQNRQNVNKRKAST